MKTVGKYVDPAEYYEAAAEHCAKAGYFHPMLVRALIDLPPDVMDDIEANPHLFSQRVSEYAYGIAMNEVAS